MSLERLALSMGNDIVCPPEITEERGLSYTDDKRFAGTS